MVAYALEHAREGYRRLTWMMIDADAAFFSPPGFGKSRTRCHLEGWTVCPKLSKVLRYLSE